MLRAYTPHWEEVGGAGTFNSGALWEDKVTGVMLLRAY